MFLKNSVSVLCAGLVLVVPVRQAQAVVATPITAEMVSSFCPITGMPGLKLGATREEQPAELRNNLRPLPDIFLPFTEAELEMTTWSGRLAAITFRGASPDGDDNTERLESFDATMIAAGWKPVVLGDTINPLTFGDGRELEREVEGPDGKLTLLLEFAAYGALSLRCGDAALLELDKREAQGTLDPGSLRPVAPPYNPALRLPDANACQSVAIQEATASRDRFDEAAPEMVPFLGAAMQESDRSLYGKRLMTWLEWKLLGSTKITDERLVTIKEKAAKVDVESEMRMMMQFLVIGGEMAKAREEGDKFGSCDALRKLMAHEYQGHQAKWAYWNKVNAALEAEAKRLGVALD